MLIRMSFQVAEHVTKENRRTHSRKRKGETRDTGNSHSRLKLREPDQLFQSHHNHTVREENRLGKLTFSLTYSELVRYLKREIDW